MARRITRGLAKAIAKTTTDAVEKEKNATEAEDSSEKSDTIEADRDFVMDRIIDNHVNTSRLHRYGKQGERLYRLHFYGYAKDEDIWEQARPLPRSKILALCEKRNLKYDANIDDAQDG